MYFGSALDLNGLLVSILVLVVNILWITLVVGLVVGLALIVKKNLFEDKKINLYSLFAVPTCPNCGTKVNADFKFCPSCQATLKETCSKCGHDLQAGWKCCPSCGTEKEVG